MAAVAPPSAPAKADTPEPSSPAAPSALSRSPAPAISRPVPVAEGPPPLGRGVLVAHAGQAAAADEAFHRRLDAPAVGAAPGAFLRGQKTQFLLAVGHQEDFLEGQARILEQVRPDSLARHDVAGSGGLDLSFAVSFFLPSSRITRSRPSRIAAPCSEKRPMTSSAVTPG